MASEFAHDNPVYTPIEPMYPRMCFSKRREMRALIARNAAGGPAGGRGVVQNQFKKEI